MSPSYFPLRWESTGDQWWFASPLDWAAAKGHYDLVRELIRLDANHLIKLTSLRRIRHLETVWDDEEQFDDVAKGKNSLIRAGHGDWLLYTAASAGDLGFARDLVEKNPLLVFGEGEYGVTDILYAAARSKNCKVFRLLFDFAVSPRFLVGDGGELEEHIGEIPCDYKWDMVNRAVHAAARGGNLKILKVLIGDCFDVSAYRDTRGSTVLHAAAGRGQVEVVKDLIASFDIINSTDKYGNTALHVASYRGQLAVVEALILVSPSSIYITNKDGETFLHMAVSGFQTPSFRRLDRQIELMTQLVCGKLFDTEDIINAKNNDGRTALYLAIIGNIHSDLVEQIMSVRSIDVNDYNSNGMTPLDLLQKHPRSASSDILTRQLISGGGISYGQDYTASRTIASHLRMRSMGRFENASDTSDSTIEDCNESNSNYKKLASINYAAERLKRLLHWPKMKERKNKMPKKMVDGNADENPIPLRQRFASFPNNKRTVSLRSSLPSPNAKKKFASGILVQGVMPDLAVPRLLFSSSFSESSISSPECLDKQKCDYVRSDIAGPSCSNQISDKRLMNQYLRFGVSALKEGLR
ncbi:unnamed protein product [Camellia sinensis]